jgi:hypothetical protein
MANNIKNVLSTMVVASGLLFSIESAALATKYRIGYMGGQSACRG